MVAMQRYTSIKSCNDKETVFFISWLLLIPVMITTGIILLYHKYRLMLENFPIILFFYARYRTVCYSFIVTYWLAIPVFLLLVK